MSDAKDTLVNYVGAAAPMVLIGISVLAGLFLVAKLIKRFFK